MSDPNSQANVDAIITQHIHLDLVVDFAAQVLKGSAVFDVEAVKDGEWFLLVSIHMTHLTRSC